MIYTEISDEYAFADWLREARVRNSSYGNCFTLEAAKAVQAWYEELSEDTGKDISFDPITWCVEWTEFDSLPEAYREQYGDDSDLPDEQRRTNADEQLEWFENNTQVIKLDNGHVIIGEF